MTHDELGLLSTTIQEKFNVAKIKQNQLEAEFEAADKELYRIQGEYRLVQEMLGGVAADNKEHEPNMTYNEYMANEDTSNHVDDIGELNARWNDSSEPSEGELTNAPDPKVAKLHEVDSSGIPAEAQVIKEHKRG